MEIYEKMPEETCTELTLAYNLMGLLYYYNGKDYEKSLKYLGQAYEISVKEMGKDHPRTSAIFINMESIGKKYERYLKWHKKRNQ